MENIAEGMTLDDTRVKISPLVPSVILDYNMRNWTKYETDDQSNIEDVKYEIKPNEYTIGVLLGIEVGSTIVVTNAFGTKYNKDETLDQNYIDFMMKYITKGTKEVIIGMFHVRKTGQDINDYKVIKAYATISELQSNKQNK